MDLVVFARATGLLDMDYVKINLRYTSINSHAAKMRLLGVTVINLPELITEKITAKLPTSETDKPTIIAPFELREKYLFEYSVSVTNGWYYKELTILYDNSADIDMALVERIMANFRFDKLDAALNANENTSRSSIDFKGTEICSARSIKIVGNGFQSVDRIRMANDCVINLSLSFGALPKLKSLHSAFRGCEELRRIDLSGTDISNVTILDQMCAETRVKEIILDSGCKLNVLTAQSMFYSNSIIESFDMNILGSNLTDISRMFYKCANLKTLKIDWTKLNNVKSIESFVYNTGLEGKIYIRDVEFSNLEDVSEAFALSHISEVLLENVSFPKLTRASTVFSGCTYLKKVQFINCDFSSLTHLRSVFENCTSLEEIYIDDKTKQTLNIMPKQSLNSMFKCTAIKSIGLEHLNITNSCDLESTFEGCAKLERIEMPKCVETDDYSDYYCNLSNTFRSCTALKYIKMNDFKSTSSSLTSLFYKCESLETVILNNWSVPKVTDLTQLFCGCKSLKNIEMNNWHIAEDKQRQFTKVGNHVYTVGKPNEPSVVSASSMFRDCSSLETLDIDIFSNKIISGIDSMFTGCTSLKTLNLHGVKILKNYSFFNNLTKLDLSGCVSLETVELPLVDIKYIGIELGENIKLRKVRASKDNFKITFNIQTDIE